MSVTVSGEELKRERFCGRPIFQGGQVSPYGYGELLVAALLGYAIFGDFPNEWTWLGAAVIAASSVYIAYREGVLGRPGGR